MNQNAPKIPCGEFAILIDYSTRIWKEIRCIGSLYLNGPGHSSLRVLPPQGTRPSNGYRAEVCISADVDHSVMMEIIQLTGDRRTMTIWKQTKPGEQDQWSFSSSASKEIGPYMLVMYPELEQLLNYLIETQ